MALKVTDGKSKIADDEAGLEVLVQPAARLNRQEIGRPVQGPLSQKTGTTKPVEKLMVKKSKKKNKSGSPIQRLLKGMSLDNIITNNKVNQGKLPGNQREKYPQR